MLMVSGQWKVGVETLHTWQLSPLNWDHAAYNRVWAPSACYTENGANAK